MPPRSPEAVWQQLVDEAGEDAVEQAAAVSVAEAERDLKGGGLRCPRGEGRGRGADCSAAVASTDVNRSAARQVITMTSRRGLKRAIEP
jgi:hypothetical protein